MHPISSDLSVQSAFPSHTASTGMQTSVAHPYCFAVHHPPANVRQNVSSLPSPQSLYASQTADCGTHLPFQQRKLLVPLHRSQSSSSLPSWQSLTLLHSQSVGMQCPFLHLNGEAIGSLHSRSAKFSVQYDSRRSWILPLQHPQ